MTRSVRILKPTVAGGELRAVDEVCDLSEKDADTLEILGKAVRVESHPEAPPKSKPAAKRAKKKKAKDAG